MNRIASRAFHPLVLSAVFATVSPAAGATLTAEMLVDLPRVREIAPHPGGGRVAYTLEVQRSDDDDPGKAYRELWVVRPGEEPRRFAGGAERITDPQWSPDGSRLSFLSERRTTEDDRRSRIWVLAADGGEASLLVDSDGSIASHHWSPDGRTIGFVALDPQTEEEKEDAKAGRDWKVVDERPKLHRLWRHDVESGESRTWIDGDLDVAKWAWNPDGSSAVAQAADNPRIDDEYMFSRLYRVSRDGEATPLAATRGKLGTMRFSPDGRRLAWMGATGLDDPLPQSLFVAGSDGKAPRNLLERIDCSVADLAWLDDRRLLALAVEGARHVLFRVDADTGAHERVEWPRRLVVRDLESVPGSGIVFLAAGSASHPDETFVFRPGDEPARLTRHSAALDDVQLAAQGVVEWTGPGEVRLTGVLTLPLDHRPGKRSPLVVQAHGGPEGVSLDGWTSSALYPVQLLAARGYVVLQPNYRGSQGRGVAFSQAVHDDLGGREFEDVLAGIDELARRGLIDPQRVGIGGWSYGGYLSALAATRYSDRFRAAIPAAGLTNWISFAGTTDIPYEMALTHWDSWWFDEPELHWQRSPLAWLERAKTPTLIVHGEADLRVHPEQSLQLYNALRIKEIPVRLVLYPREPHGLNERAHRLDFVGRVLDWFDRHLGE